MRQVGKGSRGRFCLGLKQQPPKSTMLVCRLAPWMKPRLPGQEARGAIEAESKSALRECPQCAGISDPRESGVDAPKANA